MIPELMSWLRVERLILSLLDASVVTEYALIFTADGQSGRLRALSSSAFVQAGVEEVPEP